jgi:hypothetical protein
MKFDRRNSSKNIVAIDEFRQRSHTRSPTDPLFVKRLYVKQPFEDNYVAESFLEDMRSNGMCQSLSILAVGLLMVASEQSTSDSTSIGP